MTDRIRGFYVALEADIRIDDAEPLMEAVRQLRGVAAVKPDVSDDMTDFVARQRVRRELMGKIFAVLKSEDG
jgi:hypothetical protein